MSRPRAPVAARQYAGAAPVGCLTGSVADEVSNLEITLAETNAARLDLTKMDAARRTHSSALPLSPRTIRKNRDEIRRQLAHVPAVIDPATVALYEKLNVHTSIFSHLTSAYGSGNETAGIHGASHESADYRLPLKRRIMMDLH